MIIGDSFTVGSGPVARWQSYAAQTARALDWQLITAGAAGTGFATPGRAGRTFEDSFRHELAWRPAPDLLIVSGGHNDRRPPAGQVHRAAVRLLDLVRRRWPDTTIVVIGPLWMGAVPRWAYQVRDSVALAAEQEGAAFLDPLGRHWSRTMILPDGVHPTLEGHARISRWLVTALDEKGLRSAF
ncbi:SGNH/GDSL hydrolase family protein [Planobispora takensis]|uniref:SGNH hydrolase-type esterase domain-containing protein n=1 Tax=Planobispora takensis TaxID=1367882 RepID=A0A8J3WVQ3_9ACTN|nr:SGNH/GDSL hydrolase family protein [Planobispora takensis]GII02963.1 hypothetical protein Pta02_49710 [Planobispora takensis]